MKKALSVILAMLMLVSFMGVAMAAEDGKVRVAFYLSEEAMNKDEYYYAINVDPGMDFVHMLQSKEQPLALPTKESTKTTRYTFNGWELYTKDSEGNWAATGVIKYTGTITAATEDVCWVATFAEEDIKANQTFWSFVQSIFARINDIFEYFAEVFKGVIDF